MKAIAYSILAVGSLAVCAYAEANTLLIGALATVAACIGVIGLMFTGSEK
jgi:hypothetical protein